MRDEFTLTIEGGGEQQDFNARLLVKGYTHQFCVTVNEIEVFFERDEEGRYRAIKMPWQEEKQLEKINKRLLQQIAEKIETILA